MKEIKLNINEQLYNEAEGILDEYGLEIQNILTTVLKRIGTNKIVKFTVV